MMDYTNLLRMLKTYEDGYGLYLDAADAIEELQQIAAHYEQTAKDYWKEACEYKAQLPKRGEWIEVDEIKTYCSNCNWASYSMLVQKDEFLLRNNKTKFCPNCGAKMEVQDG